MRLTPIVIFLGLPLLWIHSTLASPATTLPSLDPACIRFDDPNAVMDHEIVYADFTAYDVALAHAIDAWSPERGFTISFREAEPIGDAVPAEATLIIRDASIPDWSFKGVTVTWTNAPTTITLNRAWLPPPETSNLEDQKLVRAVMTHEFGHALGLGDVPFPGVNVRECGEMVMKRSVDKAGGRITEPQPGDITLYCMRWGGAICEDALLPITTPPLPATPVVGAVTVPAADPAGETATTYRYFVVTCQRFPAMPITPEQADRDELPRDPIQNCARAPAGVMFDILFADGSGRVVLTDRRGQFVFLKPHGLAVDVNMPEGAHGNFPSLLGFQPMMSADRIPAYDSTCSSEDQSGCKRVFVLVSVATE